MIGDGCILKPFHLSWTDSAPPFHHLSSFTTTMRSLQAQPGRINMGQGFPDFDGSSIAREAAAIALTTGRCFFETGGKGRSKAGSRAKGRKEATPKSFPQQTSGFPSFGILLPLYSFCLPPFISFHTSLVSLLPAIPLPSLQRCVCISYMHMHMHAYTYLHMYVCMHVCVHACTCARTCVDRYVCIHVFVCMYVCMSVFLYVCMYVCMYR